ncbi:M81 family metallopeptidase [Mangrovicoccus ximenensis]|uniref:M81 family metallopeptidase n=1 Tax=Mangrovicoccus ximenensis TaxID=1911570 RepID=UPI000D35BD18|nr:M81 family metallopeptidase [Mangrovicoccus ximenensis]
MRIAVTGISYEALLRSTVPTTTMEVQRGEEMIGLGLWMIRGIEERFAEETDVELVPILWGTALPGGGFTREIYEQIRDEAVAGLKAAGPLDGVVVVNHGAMEVRGMDANPDTDFLDHVAAAVGKDVPIALSLDLHGQVTQGMIDRISALSVLRTAPHRDDQSTGYRAADQLLHILRTGTKQHIARVSVPMLLPGEFCVTTASPAREIYGSLPEYDAVEGMAEANLLVGFAWNDKPWISASCIGQSWQSPEQALEMATKLARRVWSERGNFTLSMEHAEVAEGLDLAATVTEAPLFLSDSGDNTTAGAAGYSTGVLQAILDRPGLKDVVVAGITAPETVEACLAAGIGATVEIELGAEHQPADGRTRKVTATVEAGGRELKPSGFQPYLRRGGAWARVRIGHVLATFHDASIGITTPAHYEMMGIHPTEHAVYVVKLGYLHPQLEDIAARFILLLSDGASNLDVTRLDYTQLNRPAYPLDRGMEWDVSPADIATTPAEKATA